MQPCICREAEKYNLLIFTHSLISWVSKSLQKWMQGTEYFLFPYLKGQEKHMDSLEHGWKCCGLHPTRQIQDCLRTIWGLRHFTARCPSRGDPAVLGAIAGQLLLCSPSSSLPVTSCGVINVCSTTPCLHMLTRGCQNMRAVSVSCWDWIKLHRVVLVG